MSFLNALLDVGFDYGAAGGPDNFGTELVVVGGSVYPNQKRQHPLGEWELGSREVEASVLQTRLNHWHSVRGQAFAFPYKDWTDYSVTRQELVLDGTAETQLIKTYGGFGNDYTADIVLPAPGLLLELQENGAGDWVPLTPTSDYTVDLLTGVITWPGCPPYAEPDKVRWTGAFYKRVRYGVDRFRAQFLAYEDRGSTVQKIYSLSALTVREERTPLA